ERLHDRLELEVGAGLLGVPHVGVDAVRHVNHPEPLPRPPGRQRLRRCGGNHRVEQWQSDRDAHRAAQKGTAIQVLLRDEHYGYSLVCATETVASGCGLLVRIWKGKLSTIPRMMDIIR